MEVAYVSLETLRAPRASGNRIAIISPGEPFHFKEAGDSWLVNWYMVRRTGLTLFGPDPVTIIAPITQAQAAAHRIAVDRGNHRFRQALQRVQQSVVAVAERRAGTAQRVTVFGVRQQLREAVGGEQEAAIVTSLDVE